jgi:hypothetical protein
MDYRHNGPVLGPAKLDPSAKHDGFERNAIQTRS